MNPSQHGRDGKDDGLDTVLVYATFPDEAAALETGRQLVEERLAGCINILPSMTSIYIWEGQTETAREVVLIAKTRGALSTLVTEFIRCRHAYQVPAILTLPVIGGSAPYLAWLRAGTREPPA